MERVEKLPFAGYNKAQQTKVSHMKFSFYLLFFLSQSLANAAVWETKSEWNSKWESAYEDWVKSSWRVDIFTNPRSPYYGLNPDCADTVYSMRAIFSFENGLPFAFVDPSTQRTIISNQIRKFDSTPEGSGRFLKFLSWSYDILATSTLPNDSYPVAISRETVRSGGFLLAKESKHSYTIKKVSETGVPVLIYSTQANTGDLKIRSWPSVGYLFSAGIKEPSGIRNFRKIEDLLRPVWEVAGYSNEQYQVKAERWVSTMQAKLALRTESAPELLKRLMEDVCQLAQTRVELVAEAQRRIRQVGDRCFTAAEFDDLSTPSRDGQTKAAFQDLSKAYKRALKKEAKLPREMAEQLANIFSDSMSRETSLQYCSINYGRTTSLGELRRRFEADLISSNPNDTLEIRWGEDLGPSKRAKRCPSY
jgi:hypothetical protein